MEKNTTTQEGGTSSTTTSSTANATDNGNEDNTNSTYEKYIGLVEKVLKKSRKNLQTKELIRLAYGDDTTPFGGDEMLAGIMDDVLDKLASTDRDSGTVLPQFRDKCESMADPSSSVPSFQQRLGTIDEAINRVIKWETELSEAEKRDKDTAHEALASTLVSSNAGGVTVEEIVMYREYQEKLMVQKQLEEQLAQIENEADRLQEEYDTRHSQVQSKLKKLECVEKNLESAADVCSMGFVQPSSNV